MLIGIVFAVILLLIVLTVLPGWLRRRRMGDDYSTNYDPIGTKRERRQAIRDWDTLDHSKRP
jgi:hypothetical protein